MAPFHQAVKVDFLRKEGDIDIYGGVVDGEWCVGVVPNGGFVLGLIIEACIKRQARTNHPDPVHVTAHFLRATAALAPFKVHIHQLKIGRGFTNLIADLIQDGVVKITTHQYFGDLTSDRTKNASPFYLTLAPPSPYARRLPLHQHPSKAQLRTLHEAFKYSKFFKASSEPEIIARNAANSTTRSGSETIGGSGIEWGQWATLTDDGDRLTRPLIAFMVDMITPPATLLPKSEKPNMPDASWFPTLTMTLEFKFPIPTASENVYSDRTVGVYTNCRFINDPQGRHDLRVEVWSAPCNLGEGKEVEGWREKQVCLAVSTQTAIIVPMEANEKIASKGRQPKL